MQNKASTTDTLSYSIQRLHYVGPCRNQFPSEAKLGAANLILSCGSIEVQLLHSLCLTCRNINIYKKVNEGTEKDQQLISLIHTPRLSVNYEDFNLPKQEAQTSYCFQLFVNVKKETPLCK